MRQTKTGILLANLGTPDAPTPEAVKRYETIFKRQTRG
jgi:ferrochelatase